MAETPPNSGSRHPQKDRRLHARQRIHSLSYAKIGDGNGGIVLNISEGGISVQAAGVLDDSETVPMWLEIPRLRERVEVTGEIVWLSPSRKEAGLRFVDLSESALREIRKWMAQEAAPEKFEDETDPANEEQDVPPQAIEQLETLALEPRGEDLAVKDDDQEFESEPESIEEFATGGEEEQEEQKAEVRDEDRVETEAGIDEKPELEEVPAAGVPADLRTTEGATSAKQSETGDQETAEEPEAEEKHETEDDLIQSFGPPVVPFERRPHASFSSMSAISGASRGAQNLAIAPPIAHTIPQPLAEQSAPPVSAAPSDWKDFRVQLQTGWFLAALVLLLALISFIAGMAVRRGALNGVIGELEDSQAPKSAPPPDASVPPANSSGNAAANAGATPVNPLSLEIVDMVNRRWVIPAGTGGNHANTGAPGASETTGSAVSTTPEADHAAPSGIDSHAQASDRPAGSPPSAAPAGKPNVPLVLSLPETPISASGSVAISSQRSVPVPPDGSQSAKNARNLQVGQLVNLVEPAYPPEAVQQKIEGIVKLHAVIGTDGAIESLAQVSGPQILVNASMAAVRNWKYSPTRMNGQAVETQEDISFVFRLPK
jgi:outer membrane biosynthesis protein TonB/Tfp pilus assembly protein PilZ